MFDIKSFLSRVRDHITGKPYWDKLKQEMDVDKFDLTWALGRYGAKTYVAAHIIKGEDKKNDEVLIGVGRHYKDEPFGTLHTHTITKPRPFYDGDDHYELFNELVDLTLPEPLGC